MNPAWPRRSLTSLRGWYVGAVGAVLLVGCSGTNPPKPDCPPPVVLHEAQPCVCPEPEAREPWPELRAPVEVTVPALSKIEAGATAPVTGYLLTWPEFEAMLDSIGALRHRVERWEAWAP